MFGSITALRQTRADGAPAGTPVRAESGSGPPKPQPHCWWKQPGCYEGVPSEAAHYLREVENEYLRLTVTGTPVDEALRREIERLLQEIDTGVRSETPPATKVTWRSLSELEQLVLWATPEAELPLKLAHVRKRYERAMDGDSAQPAVKAATPAAMRCAAVQMLREIYRHHAAVHSRELALTALGMWMCKFILAGLALLLLLTTLSSVDWGDRPLLEALLQPWIPIIFYCGMVGSFISILRRLQDQRDSLLRTSDAVRALIGLRTGRPSVAVAMFSGGIFALVLYLILLSRLLPEGGILPDLRGAGSTAVDDFTDFVTSAGPKHARDYAMVMVWSVVAGFGERFVPDVLDRLRRQAGSKPPP
jgi:hypothetical protein